MLIRQSSPQEGDGLLYADFAEGIHRRLTQPGVFVAQSKVQSPP